MSAAPIGNQKTVTQFDFLGHRIRRGGWRKSNVTYPSKRSLEAIKYKVENLTTRATVSGAGERWVLAGTRPLRAANPATLGGDDERPVAAVLCTSRRRANLAVRGSSCGLTGSPCFGGLMHFYFGLVMYFCSGVDIGSCTTWASQ